ncbi:outer membrane protein transport protein [Xanthobacter sp. DSM 24535]|uniref:OmpP1/FadL family transporter n=1 Tax=Roseixanthobacter psychrophilus TaxID=3119917 RepID=UPI00372C066D
MSKRHALARTGSVLMMPALFLGGVSAAGAGGFALREQSAYYLGSAFAGSAAGGGAGLASMYWNPAAISFAPGLSAEGNITYIAPHASIDVAGARSALGTNLGNVGVGDIVDNGTLPTSYISYAWDRWAVGLAVTSPYGLITDAPCNWSGRYYGCYSRIFDMNATASAAYKVNEWLTLGGGVVINYIDAKLNQAQILSGAPRYLQGAAEVNGDDFAAGFTLGALFTLRPGTTIGVGYRSGLDQNLNGSTTLSLPTGNVLGKAPTTAGLNLPDQVTASLRSQLDPRWTVLGTVEWTNWSKLQELVIEPVGSNPSILSMHWQDGWFFSGGLEYQWDPKLALRAGIAYEISPVTDEYRTPRLPDSNRLWLSAGLTYAWTENLSIDLAYSHIFGETGSINLSPLDTANLTRGVLVAEVNNAYVDIVSLGVRYRFDSVPQKTALITK